MVLIHQRHRQTDRRIDRRTDDMRLQDRALHYSASRGRNHGLGQYGVRNPIILRYHFGNFMHYKG